MADKTSSGNSSPAPAAPEPGELKSRDAWFTGTPDPWSEIVLLQYDGDRTFASTVNRMVVAAEPGQRPAMEAKLLEALAHPELTDAGRAFVCRMLGLIGTATSLPAVAPLLRDERTADVARVALDPIADAGVDEAYRGALDRLTGAAKIGLIGSIADRSDAQAEAPLTAIALNAKEPVDVRDAAERAVKRLVAKP